MIYTNGNMYAYKNSLFIGSLLNNPILPNVIRNNMYLGKSGWPSDLYLDGVIDEFAMFSRVLSVIEI